MRLLTGGCTVSRQFNQQHQNWEAGELSGVDFLSNLNSSQKQAVEHFCGPLLVVAGAGSGKTRALTYRIANLVMFHQIEPDNILAVTFTNKAAREMKERIERLFAEQESQRLHQKSFTELAPAQQMRLRSQVYRHYTKNLWIGTFHALCARILRFDIEKYKDSQGRSWNRNFSIFDESDAQALVKDIVTNQMNLDEKKFEPKSIRYAISNAKNLSQTPEALEIDQPNFRGRTIANVYRHYQTTLLENNALDFDDLIWIPVQLFRQNQEVLGYWHRRFRHILVDEYQDTNHTQYELIKWLSTNGNHPRSPELWRDRSIFVVGDADQSIYSFRSADFKILMGFQQDFGDGLADDQTRTMVKLEENYRSTENILAVANELIENNTERIDKVLRPTRGSGEPIGLYRADDEMAEAEFITQQIRQLERNDANLTFGQFAILYRTNAQSRALEESLVRWGIPYKVVGGLRFYDRKEIKDVLAYLRAIVNPADSVSLLRVINTPRRGIGKSSIDALSNAAQTLGVPLWEILSDETSVKTVAGRASRSVTSFADLIARWQTELEHRPASQIVQGVLEESGYVADLKSQDTDEASDRLRNVEELYNAVRQFEEENEDSRLINFLASASLASDLDDSQEEASKVTLMTLHSSKGLEFPIVFLAGLENGLFPSFRSLDNPAALEEERRLCYVGITRAQERLFITYAKERRLYGNRQMATPSMFLAELPRPLIQIYGAGGLPKKNSRSSTANASTTEGIPLRRGRVIEKPVSPQSASPQSWQVGDRAIHPKFGPGEVTHVFEGGKTLALKFAGQGTKIINPKLTALQKMGG